jgi:hypothetical protein
VLASKLMGAILIFSYVLSARLLLNADVSLMIWRIFVAVLICMIDLWMARFISASNDAARGKYQSVRRILSALQRCKLDTPLLAAGYLISL